MYYIDIVTLLHWHYYYIYFYIYWHCYIHTLLHKFVALFITYIGKSAGTWCLPLNPHQRLVFAGWETKYAISTFIGLLIISICIILVFVFSHICICIIFLFCQNFWGNIISISLYSAYSNIYMFLFVLMFIFSHVYLFSVTCDYLSVCLSISPIVYSMNNSHNVFP